MAMMKGSTGLGLAVGLGGLGSAALGCGPRLDDEHCLFHRGDLHCEADRACVVEIGGGRRDGERHGCLAGELDDRQLHLRDGLPRGAVGPGLDTVEDALLQRLDAGGLEEVCTLDDGLPPSIAELHTLPLVFGARARLDLLRRERRIRDEPAWIDEVEAAAVRELHAAIDAWEAECMALSTSTTEGATTLGEDESTATDGACSTDEECRDPERPLCSIAGECVASCSSTPDPHASCEALDPAAPVCLEDACVACTAERDEACGGLTPVCDDQTNTCVPCSSHAQCGKAACDLFSGACLPDDAIAHVGPDEDHDSIPDALTALGVEGTVILHDEIQDASVTVAEGSRFAVLAAPGIRPRWSSTGVPQLLVRGTVLLDGLDLAGNEGGTGLLLDGGSAWLDRTAVVDNDLGIDATLGAQLVVRNGIVGHIAGDGHDAVLVGPEAEASFLYTMLFGDAGGGQSLACTGTPVVVARNSALVTYSGNPIVCDSLELTDSATTGTVPGWGNIDVGTVDTSWFVGSASGDYHLTADALVLLADIARWRVGDPATDIDGSPRPTTDGDADYAGADVPQLR